MSKTRGTWRRFVLNHCVRAKRVWLKNLHLQSLHVSCPVFFTVQVRCENWDAGPVPIAWFNLLTLKKGTCSHKYLGRKYSGDLTKRRRIGFQHRVHLAWAKFEKIANHWQTSAFQSSYACICLTQLWPLLSCSVWPREQHLIWINWMQYNVACFDL